MNNSFIFHFLPLLILVLGISALASSELEPVRDTSGNILRTGVDYYILPFARGRVGGVTLSPTRNNTLCPLDVIQGSNQLSNGTPFTFTPVNPKKGTIRTSTDLNIEFSGVTICIQSTVWKLDEFDEVTGQTFITTRGVKGNPGFETLGNWFKIEKIDVGEYKFVFCPSVCETCRPRCSDIGIYLEDGVRRLALSDVPMFIRFKKAETSSIEDN